MKVPLSWLKEYVDIAVPPPELAHRLTMAGVEVGAVIPYGGSWEHVFVGYVKQVAPHPNADRLTLCTVDPGGQQVIVVCGAPNVAAGQKIAYARVGASLFNPHTGAREVLKAARIRGVTSEGMICSELELGLGQDHTGILVLPQDVPVGTPLADYLGDVILDLEVTPNRPDCLSVLGIAREVAALTGVPLREPAIHYQESGGPIEERTSVEILDPDLCPRYTCSLLEGVRVGPSPQWLQDRLLKAGMRPINNVVDVTNYVMLEYGQPLHAFDYEGLQEGRIVVRQARPAERLVTLDGQEHHLEPPMLVIADAQDAVALAGLMGGASSEVTERTTAVLLESASFAPTSLRRTARLTGVHTEASQRFERGLRPHLPPVALRRATQFIHDLAGGAVAQGVVDAFPMGGDLPQMTFTMERLRKVLGVDIPMDRVQGVLASLGLQSQQEGPNALLVTIPYWRSDITIEDDLVEEVARIIGYDAIPTTMLSSPIPYHQPQPLRELRERVKDMLVKAGMQETISYSLTSRETLERAHGLEGGLEPLRVANPMSQEQEYLRTTLRGSVLSTLAANLRRQERGLRLFEAGRVYLPQAEGLPHEREMVVGLLSGARWESAWMTSEDVLDLFDVKGTLEALMGELGVVAAFDPVLDATLHPGRSAQIRVGERVVGVLGEVHPDVLEGFDIEVSPVALFELDLERLLEALPEGPRQFQFFPRVPGALRDLALVVDARVPAARVQAILGGHPLVARVTLFDVYTGEHVPRGTRSLAYRVLFQSPERTLTAEEVDQALERILRLLEREVKARLRG